MKFKISDLKKFGASKTTNNKHPLLKNGYNGRCYYCGEFFDPGAIDMWDNSGICFCPKCGIDSILPKSNEYDIENDLFIEAMALYWFNGYARITDEKKNTIGDLYHQRYFELIQDDTL